MSITPSGRRFRTQEFMLPSGKKVVAGLPADIPTLRRKYSAVPGAETDVDIVSHGSEEHINYLRQVHSHHESRRDQIRARFGDVADDWEDAHRQATSVSGEIERLSRRDTTLEHNFAKFGYADGLRTYDGVLGDGQELDAAPDGGTGSGTTTPSGAGKKHHHGRGDSTKLFKRPIVRQWFHRGIIWRAADQTEIMAIELFFDLLYGTWPLLDHIC